MDEENVLRPQVPLLSTDERGDRRAVLSTLWIFVLLNMLFRDVHEIPTQEFLEQAITGRVNGVEITDELLLIGGVVVELLILMVLLSRVLPYAINRWANIVMGGLAMASTVFNNMAPDPDDAFFAAVQFVALAAVVVLAWQWRLTSQEESRSTVPA